MNKNNTQSVALFMAFIVLTIPIITAQAYATVTTYSVNSQGVKNYRAVTDSVKLVAEIDDTAATASDVKILSSQNLPFQNCVVNGAISVCNYQYTQSQWDPAVIGGKVDYTVSYKGQTAASSIRIDNRAPNVTINSINPGAKLALGFTIRERAYDENDASSCSGIKTINFVLAGQVIASSSMSGQLCDFSNTTSIDAPSTNNVAKSFCIEAIDAVGNRASTCADVIIDKEAAKASGGTVIASDGTNVDYIAPQVGSLSTRLRFTVNEQDIASISADTSDFGDSGIKTPVCSPVSCDGQCTCDVPVTISSLETGTKNLKVSIIDGSNIQSNITVPFTIKIDDTAPKLISLTGKQCGTVNALGALDNTITATIQDSGSGLHQRKVYLDLSSALGSQFDHVFPNTCAQSGSQWICTWGPFGITTSPSHGASLPIQIVSPSQDDAGNFMEAASTGFYYDSHPPVFVSSSLQAARNVAFGVDIQAYPTSGGTIQLKINAQDDLPLKAVADFSQVSYAGSKTANCVSDTPGQQTCTFSEIGPLYNGPLFNKQILINLTDCAGNIQSVSVPINVSVISTQGSDLWTYTNDAPMPTVVDRQTLSQFSRPVYFPVHAFASPDVTPISQQIVQCDGKLADGTPLTNYLDLNHIGVRLPDLIASPNRETYAKFTIQRGTNPPDSMDYTCIVKTISATSGGAITQPEYDNLTFTIKSQATVIGKLEDSVQSKVDGVKNSALVQANILSDLSDVLNFLDRLCTLWSVVTTVGSVINGVNQALQVFGIAVLEPVDQAYTKFLHGTSTSATGKPDGGIGPTIERYCKFINCETVPLSDVKDIFNSLQSGQIFGLNLEKTFGFTNDQPQTSANNVQKNPASDFDLQPRNSLIVSMATLCIPGIVANLQKARQIECNYVKCVDTQVKEGIPLYFCDALRAEQWCKYVWGEAFQFIPFARFIDAMLSRAKKLITDPIYAASFAISICSQEGGPIAPACRFVKNVAAAGSAINDLVSKSTWDSISHGTSDACSEIGVGKD